MRGGGGNASERAEDFKCLGTISETRFQICVPRSCENTSSRLINVIINLAGHPEPGYLLAAGKCYERPSLPSVFWDTELRDASFSVRSFQRGPSNLNPAHLPEVTQEWAVFGQIIWGMGECKRNGESSAWNPINLAFLILIQKLGV